MSCVDFARFCKLELTDVVVCKIIVKCLFVPFDRMVSVEEAIFFVSNIYSPLTTSRNRCLV